MNSDLYVLFRDAPIANRNAHRSLSPPGRTAEPRKTLLLDMVDNLVGRDIVSTVPPEETNKTLIDDGIRQHLYAVQLSDFGY